MNLELSPILVGALIVIVSGLVLIVSGDSWSSLPFWLRNALVIVFFIGLAVIGLSFLQ